MSKKLLLIEDNLDVRENTAEILELADFDVITAENGKEGVSLAREHMPDLIICDIMMPELDGYGVLHILSKNPDTATIPFIFLTAKAEKSDLRKGMNLGADDYLTKPFDEMELMDAIESRLRRSEALKSKYEQNLDGLNSFLENAKHHGGLKSITENKRSKFYKKKESIFREGDFANGIYFVNSGKVKTYKINEDGKEYVTGLYSTGDFLGYLSVLDEVDYPDTAAVLEDAELVHIDKQEFLELIYGNREVSNEFIKILSNNLLEKEQELIDLAYNTVRKRVADALIRLKEKYEKEQGENFSIAISRSDLASLVGTAQESVIRFLSEFKEDGLIEIQGSQITIVEPRKLQAMKY